MAESIPIPVYDHVLDSVVAHTHVDTGQAATTREAIGRSSPQINPSISYQMNGIVSTGTSKFGDSTNYSQFDATGHLTMAGTAKPWTDVRIEPSVRGTGSNNPSFEQYFTNGSGSRGLYLYTFDDVIAAQEKEVFFTLQMPHEWDGGDIHLHVHWIPSVDDTTATPRWGLEYNFKSPGQVYGNSTIIYAVGNEQGAADLVANTHYITEFDPITPDTSQNGLSAILIGRLFRNSSNSADTYNASSNKCGLLYIDAHFQLSSIGSTDEYAK